MKKKNPKVSVSGFNFIFGLRVVTSNRAVADVELHV